MVIDTPTDRKCYGQICTVTNALDIAGDRWTLLILRELLGGPARFEELVGGLPGIARNLLTTRLRRLEGDGIVRRVDSQGSSLYALTELGEGSRPVLEALGFWGVQLQRVGPVEHRRSIRSIAMAIQAILSRAGDALPRRRAVVELNVDGEHVEIELGPSPTALARLGTRPDARMGVDRETLSNVLVGLPFEDARFEVVSGDPDLRSLLLKALRSPFGQ